MNLEHLPKTLEICVQYHEQRGNTTTASRLKQKIEDLKAVKLADTGEKGLYLD